MSIPFTQYLLPDGRRKHIEIERPAPIEAMAQEIRTAGFRFEAEVLTNGVVSLTIYSQELEEDVAIKLCSNDAMVPAAVDVLVAQFYEKLRKK